MPKVGAHVSAAVSLDLSLDKAKNIGAECSQIFISPPRQWIQTLHDDKEIERYISKAQEFDISPNFVHGTYLINLGSQNKEHIQKSIEWLIWALNLTSKLKMKGLIFHMGSHKGLGFEKVKEQVVYSLRVILRDDSGPAIAGSSARMTEPFLILENPVATGGNLGSNLQELGWILKTCQDDRLKVCLDLQHAFASGYDLKTPIGLKDFLEEFEIEIGLNNLVAIHANDSKVEYKSLRDRHENIGDGFIGREGFSNIVNNPSLADIPFILEVPGFQKGGPDKENVSILKSLNKYIIDLK